MRRRGFALAGAALAVFAAAFPGVGGSLARGPALRKASERLARAVTAQGSRLGLGRLTLTGVRAEGLFRAGKLEVGLALWPLLAGRLQVEKVLLSDVDIELQRRERGPRGASGRLPHVVVERGRAHVVDEARGLEVTVGRFDADLPPDSPGSATLEEIKVQTTLGPSAGAKQVELAFPSGPRSIPAVTVEGGRAAIWRGLELTGIAGTVRPTDGGTLAVALRGGYLGSPGELWRATGDVEPRARTAAIDLSASRFTLDRIGPVLKEGLLVNPQLASVDAELRLRAEPAASGGLAISFDGKLDAAGLTVFHESLADEPVPDLTVASQIRGKLDTSRRTLAIDEAIIRSRGATALVSGTIDGSRKPARYEGRLRIPTLPCRAALAALPAEIFPKISGFKLDGKFAVDLSVVIDKADLDATGIYGAVGIDGCKVLAAPDATSAKRLDEPFEHTVLIKPGEELKFTIGPQNPDFAPIAEISPHVVASLLTTEDNGFFKHRGIVPSQIREALRKNVERGYFRLGASTITMQMVKNVLLAREKTLARKLQELFLTWYVERSLDKDRILEIYLNAIEFGPRIYGIGRAARHYFGKKAKDLTPREGAFFSSILPSPKRRYVHFCNGAPNDRWEKYLDRILRRMFERGRLTDAELQAALAQKLSFDPAERGTEKECFARMNELIPKLPEPDVPDEDELDGGDGGGPSVGGKRGKKKHRKR